PILLPPPPSTLFPYTTLFRSTADRQLPPQPHRLRAAVLRGRSLHRQLRDRPRLRAAAAGAAHLARLRRLGPAAQQRADRRARRLDRKSTRLNSSHLVISYAVF